MKHKILDWLLLPLLLLSIIVAGVSSVVAVSAYLSTAGAIAIGGAVCCVLVYFIAAAIERVY